MTARFVRKRPVLDDSCLSFGHVPNANRLRRIASNFFVGLSFFAAAVWFVTDVAAQPTEESKRSEQKAGEQKTVGSKDAGPSPVVQLIEATVKLANPKSTATGILVRVSAGPDAPKNDVYVVTAAHVLDAVDGNSLTLLLRPRGTDGRYQKHIHELAVRRDGQPLWKRHEAADVAVIRATLPETLNLSIVPVEWLADDDAVRARQLDPGDLIRFVGFPHRIEGNGAGFPVVRLGCLATHPLTPLIENRTIMFDGNTFEGDSGGPAYAPPREHIRAATGASAAETSATAAGTANGTVSPTDTPLILGLVVGQHFLDEEMKTIYGQTKTRHRLGLGIIAPAPFIRQLLK